MSLGLFLVNTQPSIENPRERGENLERRSILSSHNPWLYSNIKTLPITSPIILRASPRSPSMGPHDNQCELNLLTNDYFLPRSESMLHSIIKNHDLIARSMYSNPRHKSSFLCNVFYQFFHESN